MVNEKTRWHGERSVAVRHDRHAVWTPWRRSPPGALPPAAGATATPGEAANFRHAAALLLSRQGLDELKREMRSYLDRGYNVVKMKIGGAPLAEDQRRIEAVLGELGPGQRLASMPTGASTFRPPLRTATRSCPTISSGTRRP